MRVEEDGKIDFDTDAECSGCRKVKPTFRVVCFFPANSSAGCCYDRVSVCYSCLTAGYKEFGESKKKLSENVLKEVSEETPS